jgi:transcriptional regulator with XRE-family HTH domain
MRDWKEVETELLENPETMAAFESMRLHYEIVSAIIAARSEQGLTQEELAARTGLQRSNISRLESGNYNPSVDLLSRVARGLGKELHIEFRVPANPTLGKRTP